jgi:hypothetical protein
MGAKMVGICCRKINGKRLDKINRTKYHKTYQFLNWIL